MYQYLKDHLRFVAYAIFIFAAYIIQFTPFMFPIFNCYPMPILSLVIVFSMFEKNFTASVLGLICGMLSDINMINGNGLHALVYMFSALALSLLVQAFFKNNCLSLTVIAFFVFMLNSVFEFLTKATLTSGALDLYISRFWGSAVYSIVITVPIYLTVALVLGHRLKYTKPKGILPDNNKKHSLWNKNTKNLKGF